MHEMGEGMSPDKAAIMALTLFFAINKFAQPDYVFLPLPCRPPEGYIMEVMGFFLISAVFMPIMLIVYKRITCQVIRMRLDQILRQLSRMTQLAFYQNLCQWFWTICTHNKQALLATNARWIRKYPRAMELTLENSDNLSFLLPRLIDAILAEIVGEDIDRSSTDLHYFDASSDLDDVEEEFFNAIDMTESMSVFSTSFADQPTSIFDSDSALFVCDNSATGHVCNDISLFEGSLSDATFSVDTANGTATDLKMGTVILRLLDDEGVEHVFKLLNCVYVPKSPVNILSLRRLAEQFKSDKGSIDYKGTGITSVYQEHELFWDRRRFSKSFITANSGLPELLFNSGYGKFEVYVSKMKKHLDDSVEWSSTSSAKSNDPADGTTFVPGMTIVYKDGAGKIN